MANDSTFDIVSKVEPQETAKQISQRYASAQRDFNGASRGTDCRHDKIEERVKAANDVLESKLIKHGISLTSYEASEPSSPVRPTGSRAESKKS